MTAPSSLSVTRRFSETFQALEADCSERSLTKLEICASTLLDLSPQALSVKFRGDAKEELRCQEYLRAINVLAARLKTQVQTWHEFGGETEQEVQVTSPLHGDLTIKISEDRRSIPHKNKFRNPYRVKY
ncbi:MAG: hypothetical protein ACKVX7_17955 [Planctomycetota bacterium]